MYRVYAHIGRTDEVTPVRHRETNNKGSAYVFAIGSAISICNELSRDFKGVELCVKDDFIFVYINNDYFCSYFVVETCD